MEYINNQENFLSCLCKFDKIPTKEDWGEINWEDNDMVWAYEHYLGWSRDDLEKRFITQSNTTEWLDTIFWMPKEPFCYYWCGIIDFIVKKKYVNYPNDWDPEFGNESICRFFLALCKNKLLKNPHIIAPVMDGVILVTEVILSEEYKFSEDATRDEILELSRDVRKIWNKVKSNILG